MIMSTIIIHAKAALPGKGQAIVNDATLVASEGVIQRIDSRQAVSCPTEADQVYNFDDQYLLPGHRADLVLVADNPLANISTLRQPSAVFQNGRLVARDDLL